MKDLWGSPEDLKRGKGKQTKGKGKGRGIGNTPFSNSTSLKDMKSTGLTDKGGWGKDGVKASKGFRVKKGGTQDKTLKSLGF